MQRRVICGFILATNNYDTGKEIDDALPLVIAVTGHRDLLSVMSSLAEGADRAGCGVALGLGIGLVVPLPMPRHLYEKDFSTPDSLEQFRALCDRASELFELPMARGSTVEQIAEPGYGTGSTRSCRVR